MEYKYLTNEGSRLHICAYEVLNWLLLTKCLARLLLLATLSSILWRRDRAAAREVVPSEVQSYNYSDVKVKATIDRAIIIFGIFDYCRNFELSDQIRYRCEATSVNDMMTPLP